MIWECWRISGTCCISLRSLWHQFSLSARNNPAIGPCMPGTTPQHDCRRSSCAFPRVCSSLLQGWHTSEEGLRILSCRFGHRTSCSERPSISTAWLFSYLSGAHCLWGTGLWGHPVFFGRYAIDGLGLLYWILGEFRTSTRTTFSWSASFVEANRVSAFPSLFCDLEI